MPELVLYGIRLLAKHPLGTDLDMELDQSAPLSPRSLSVDWAAGPSEFPQFIFTASDHTAPCKPSGRIFLIFCSLLIKGLSVPIKLLFTYLRIIWTCTFRCTFIVHLNSVAGKVNNEKVFKFYFMTTKCSTLVFKMTNWANFTCWSSQGFLCRSVPAGIESHVRDFSDFPVRKGRGDTRRGEGLEAKPFSHHQEFWMDVDCRFSHILHGCVVLIDPQLCKTINWILPRSISLPVTVVKIRHSQPASLKYVRRLRLQDIKYRNWSIYACKVLTKIKLGALYIIRGCLHNTIHHAPSHSIHRQFSYQLQRSVRSLFDSAK